MYLYVLTYHEIQIAGFRIFPLLEDAVKEYLKHCIMETQSLLEEEQLSQSESDVSSISELSCVLEVQELQNNEYVTIKEYDFETFQDIIDEKEDIDSFLTELDRSLEEKVPDDILAKFKQ